MFGSNFAEGSILSLGAYSPYESKKKSRVFSLSSFLALFWPRAKTFLASFWSCFGKFHAEVLCWCNIVANSMDMFFMVDFERKFMLSLRGFPLYEDEKEVHTWYTGGGKAFAMMLV